MITNNKRATATDVARAAGVSQPTVSRAFAPESRVDPEKRARILAAAEALGYHPNAFARGLAQGQSGIIALVASGLDDTFLSVVLRGLVAGLQARGLQLLTFDLEAREQLPRVLDSLHAYNIDGMIFTSAYLEDEDVRRVAEMGKPIVMLNHAVKAPHVRAVCCDNAGGGARIADHFLVRGYRTLALVRGPAWSYTARERAGGFLSRLQAQGAAAEAQVYAEKLGYEAGRDAMRALLDKLPAVDAVFCTNDILALGAADAARERGNHAAIAGFDGHQACAWPTYDLTTIRQPTEALVRTAIDTLCAMLDGGEADIPYRQQLDGELIVRASTGA